MTDRAKKLLWDMRDAGERIRHIVSDHTEASFIEHPVAYFAVERMFEIMGEAAARLRNDEPNVFGSDAAFRRILELRNRLIHAYDFIDPAKIWQYTQVDLPAFMPTLTALLSEPLT